MRGGSLLKRWRMPPPLTLTLSPHAGRGEREAPGSHYRTYLANSFNPRRMSFAVSASVPRSRAAMAMACEACAGL